MDNNNARFDGKLNMDIELTKEAIREPITSISAALIMRAVGKITNTPVNDPAQYAAMTMIPVMTGVAHGMTADEIRSIVEEGIQTAQRAGLFTSTRGEAAATMARLAQRQEAQDVLSRLMPSLEDIDDNAIKH